MEPDWVEPMRDLYQRLDASQASESHVCNGCGECCCFDRMDHVLYASELERRFLVLTAPPPQRPDGPAELIASGLRCPWQVEGRCEAREGRTLGCRLHFCSRDDSTEESETAERWHNELKRLHDELGIGWEYRPLLPVQ